MVIDSSQSQESDLDRTDRLPILTGVVIDEDVPDDAVRLEYSPPGPSSGAALASLANLHLPAPDFMRPGVDLPSLAESVRTVEERIARQNADYEALNRLYEKARDAHLDAGTRAETLSSELSAVQAALAVEQHRTREMERALAQSTAATEASRARAEEVSREAERFHSESRTLREALATRDATIAQALHSLGERDAQLFALQREHAQTVPMLEARSRAGAQLQTDVDAARASAEALSLELKKSQETVSSLTARISRDESELAAGRRDLSIARAQASSHLELLRTRDWRGGFNQNLFREWDDKVNAARSDHGALQAECERLTQSVTSLTGKLAEQDATIARVQAATAADSTALSKMSHELEAAQAARAEMVSRIDKLEAERNGLQSELGARNGELAAARNANAAEIATARSIYAAELAAARSAQAGELAAARNSHAAELQRALDSQAASETKQSELSAQLEQLRALELTHEEEVSILMAHLKEARRPIQSIEADIKRLNDEIALKTATLEQLTEENRTLRSSLERTRGALEERELLIRRLEKNANTNANVLGRLQTSIEKLGSAPPSPPSSGEFLAELIRLDGDTRTAYPLGRRTRIGRAVGCELQIDSQSVSRHHAMLLKGAREIIIEDLNSTNGVLVNGRKVTRHMLTDGDVLTIGETQFQCRLKPNPRSSEALGEPAASIAMGAVAAPAAVLPPSAPAAVETRPNSDSKPAEPLNQAQSAD
ncbi:MAG: FHA domain-containing protein [Steroidobacteraceae bacterium]|jgi:predicted  nucleic acid-binding Zn-ribbon protein